MKKFNFKEFKNGPKNLLLLTFVFLVFFLMVSFLTDVSRDIQDVPYSKLINDIKSGQIAKIKISGDSAFGTYKNNQGRFRSTISQNQDFWKIFNENISSDQKIEEAKIESQSGDYFGAWNLFYLLSLIMPLLLFWYLMRQSKSGNNSGGPNIFSMGKSKAKMFTPMQVKVNFDSVAGAYGAKEDLQDIVDFLKNPEKYKKVGAKLSKGVLLVGEPGNGKTLLAKAVAGEANCSFFSVSGSDFIEVFVGVGASRIRDLFAQARKSSPSIIFIDEIDSIGRHRTISHGGSEEREQTLNQLLSEMDGFETSMSGSVVVIAATNRPDILDKALLRKGRFDRMVHVPYPDLVSREAILKVHAKSIHMSSDVDLKVVAKGTPGFSGADLASIVNEAAINAAKNNRSEANSLDFEEAKDRIIMGKKNTSITLSEEERKKTAYHEAGHAIAALFVPHNSLKLHKVTIVPMGGSLGSTHSLPDKDLFSFSKEQMLADIIVSLGGRAAEELVFNSLEKGILSDFKSATGRARDMVTYYGMSDILGNVYYGDPEDQWYSEQTAQMIDSEVRRIIAESYKKTVEILTERRRELDLLANELLEKETLNAEEIVKLIGLDKN